MARRPARPPAPTEGAMARIGEMISRGATADRVGREAAKVAEEWAGQGDEGREMILVVLDMLADGLAAAEEQASDVDRTDPSAEVATRNTVAALRAARQAFSGTGG